MQVQKLRVAANGLVPAGAYFASIAARLEQLNASEAERQADLDDEDRRLEALYRRRSGARAANAEQHAMM